MRPTCHPDRPHQAFGLCRLCYLAHYRGSKVYRPRPVIEIERYDPRVSIPPRIAGVRQNAVGAFPMAECPKCHNTVLSYDAREARCAVGCGATYYLVKETPDAVPADEPTLTAV